ncbi:MAG: SDR family NAD(P)-dependent oxidoreductase, partial [Anaerolineae bacterium]|nr:SDR family NAD(P)-dependent oxidoreductase [Anaerolineae bacterium]
SYISVPLMSAYCAAKHAVLGFTDSLRMELNAENSSIAVSIILPAGINTPFFNNARSKLGVKPMPLPPAYAPELAASVVVYAAQNPRREFHVGGASWFFILMYRLSPMLTERFMLIGNWVARLQKSRQPDDSRDNLYAPTEGDGRVRGDFGHMTKPSLYTRLFETTPTWAKLLASAVLFGVMAFARTRSNADNE